MYSHPDIGSQIQEYMHAHKIRAAQVVREHAAYMGFASRSTAENFISGVRQGHLLGHFYKGESKAEENLARLSRFLATLRLPNDHPIVEKIRDITPIFAYPPSEMPSQGTLDDHVARLSKPDARVVDALSARLVQYAMPDREIPKSIHARTGLLPEQDRLLIEEIIRRFEQ